MYAHVHTHVHLMIHTCTKFQNGLPFSPFSLPFCFLPFTSTLSLPLPLDRYAWVDVGMLDYDAERKCYLVKRVHVPKHVLEKAEEAEKETMKKTAEEREKKGMYYRRILLQAPMYR